MAKDYQKTILENGLRLITCPMPQSQSVSVVIFAGTGSRFEDERTSGISHFLEHMLFKGTKKRPTPLAISTAIDGIGGEFNAYTSKDHTAYHIKALPFHIGTAFDVLTDMVLNSKFPEAGIQTERGVILQEMAMYEDLPQRKVANKFESLIFAGSKLAWDILGTQKSLSQITRQDFFQYTKTHYHPENLITVVAGKFAKNQAVELTKKYLGQLKSSSKTIKPHQDHFSQTRPESEIATKKTEQTHLVLGWRGFPLGHPTRYIEAVLAALAGGPMSSRLFQEVREKRGLAYYVKSDVAHYLDTGYLAVHAGVKIKSTNQAIKVILSECHKLAQSPPKPKELSVAKEWLKGSITLDLEDSLEKAKLYGYDEIMEGKIHTPQEMIKAIDKVTGEDVKKVAKDLFISRGLNLAVIGPHEKDEFDPLLK